MSSRGGYAVNDSYPVYSVMTVTKEKSALNRNGKPAKCQSCKAVIAVGDFVCWQKKTHQQYFLGRPAEGEKPQPYRVFWHCEGCFRLDGYTRNADKLKAKKLKQKLGSDSETSDEFLKGLAAILRHRFEGYGRLQPAQQVVIRAIMQNGTYEGALSAAPAKDEGESDDAEEAAPSKKKASAKKASTKKASTKKASTKKAPAKKASTRKVSTKRATTKQTSTKKAATSTSNKGKVSRKPSGGRKRKAVGEGEGAPPKKRAKA